MKLIVNIYTVYFAGVLWFCELLPVLTDDIKIDFNNKVVLITDTCSIIGASLAYRLAKLGAVLSLSGRNVTYLDYVAKECSLVSKSKPFTVFSDFTNRTTLKHALNETLKTYSKVDVLIFNPDFVANKHYSHEDFTEGPANYTIRAYLSFLKAALPYLEKTKGTVINIGEIVVKGFPIEVDEIGNVFQQLARYAVNKYKIKNVRFNELNPGLLYDRKYNSFLQKCEVLDQQPHGVDLIYDYNKNFTAEDTTIEFIIKVVTYLASSHANVSNGDQFTINGNEVIDTESLQYLYLRS